MRAVCSLPVDPMPGGQTDAGTGNGSLQLLVAGAQKLAAHHKPHLRTIMTGRNEARTIGNWIIKSGEHAARPHLRDGDPGLALTDQIERRLHVHLLGGERWRRGASPISIL